MAIPLLPVFLVLFGAYLLYSVWARLDPRYPIVAGFGLLVVTAGVDLANAGPEANTLAEYVACLLVGGAALLLLERLRQVRRGSGWEPGLPGSLGAERPPAQAADQRHRSSEDLLDGVQEQLVSPVDAPRREDDPHERRGDPEPEDR
jgi:hypothetical protein